MNNFCKKIISSSICLAVMAFTSGIVTAEGDDNNATSIGAEITNAGDNNVAVGNSTLIINGSNNDATSTGALVIGGSGNVAIGTNAAIYNGSGQQAIGYGAIAGYGNNNTAVGNNANAGGLYTGPRSDENVAIGSNATAYGGSAVAIGAFSVANEPNTVSVGQPGYERRITNVAPGVYSTDAVNMSQLWDTDNRINRLGATAMAMSGLAPMGYNPKEPTQFSAAVGTYGGKTGYAFGVYHYTHESVMLSAAISMSSDGWEKAGRIGITWWAGHSKNKKAEVVDNTIYATNVQGKPIQEKSKKPATNSNIIDNNK